MSKKIILLIVGILVLIGVIGFYIYYQKSANVNGSTATNVFKNFFPFGVSNGTVKNTNGDVSNGTTVDANGNIVTINSDASKGLLNKITGFSIAGATSFINNRTKSVTDQTTGIQSNTIENAPAIRYVERSNGHVHEMFTDTKIDKEISISTIPAIYEATFSGTGNTTIYRYLDKTDKIVESFFSTVGVPSGQYLPERITTVSADPTSDTFYYMTINNSGETSGFLFNPDNSSTTKIFSSPFTEWNSEWPVKNSIYLTTKPSWDTEGEMYSLNPNTGLYTKILGGFKGLTTKISPDGNHVVYSKNTKEGLKLIAYNIKKASSIDLAQNTFADKCVFALNTIDAYCAVPNLPPTNKNPDNWYQGIESFTDSIYKINTNTGISTFIINTNIKDGVDATNLFLDKTENYLYFTNKKDSTLWSLVLVK